MGICRRRSDYVGNLHSSWIREGQKMNRLRFMLGCVLGGCASAAHPLQDQVQDQCPSCRQFQIPWKTDSFFGESNKLTVACSLCGVVYLTEWGKAPDADS